MKKILAILILAASVAVFAGPVLAATTQCCQIHSTFKFDGQTWEAGKCYGNVSDACVDVNGKQLCSATEARDSWGVACVLNSIYRATNVIFAILLVLGIILGLYAGYNFMTSAGDEKKVETARNYFLYAIIGIIVAFFARAIPSIVALIL
ncbi:hypothetical protein J7J18_03460 [bacterium]|nr:hypothetical protein [bacterium]